MKEKAVNGTRGFLLYNPFTKRHFFRIYMVDKKFVDYTISAEDIEVTILDEDNYLSIYEMDDGEENRLDWSSKTLGK